MVLDKASICFARRCRCLPPGRRGSIRAISIIEMLVVIAIVAALAAICLPVFGQLRESSRSAKCMQNMRNVAGVLLSYSAENNNILPPAVILTGPGVGDSWVVYLHNAGVFRKESYDKLESGVMTCPSRGEVAGGKAGGWSNMQYGLNQYPGFSNILAIGQAPFRMASVSKPGVTMLLGEVNNRYAIFANDVTKDAAFPHQGRNNIIFLDGHGETSKGPWQKPNATDSYPFY